MAPSASRVPMCGPAMRIGQVGTTKGARSTRPWPASPGSASQRGSEMAPHASHGPSGDRSRQRDRRTGRRRCCSRWMHGTAAWSSGSASIRRPWNPAPAGTRSPSPIRPRAPLPDMEELAVEPAPIAADLAVRHRRQRWQPRTNLNVYSVDGRRSVGRARRPARSQPTRFPIQVVAPEGPQAANVEGAFVDPAAGTCPPPST